jgi:hypothetical protein
MDREEIALNLAKRLLSVLEVVSDAYVEQAKALDKLNQMLGRETPDDVEGLAIDVTRLGHLSRGIIVTLEDSRE